MVVEYRGASGWGAANDDRLIAGLAMNLAYFIHSHS
jgi:hypothetical protein